MGNFTLNLYKAFGLKKAKRQQYRVALHDFVYDKDNNPMNDGLDTRAFAPMPSSSSVRPTDPPTHKSLTAQKAMERAINHVRKTNSPATIYTPTEGQALLYAHPTTNLLTLRHVTHGTDENDLVENSTNTNFQEDLANRDTAALNRLKHLHENSLSTLGDIPMQVDSYDLYHLPAELHTTQEAREFNE